MELDFHQRRVLERAQDFSEYSNEEWRLVPDFSGYAVSSYGQVYSWRSDRLLRPSYDRGYLHTSLRDNGRTYSMSVHKLVAVTFFGEPSEEGLEVNHDDGDGTNNYIGNLAWMTHEENVRHRKEVLRREEKWREEVEVRKTARESVTNEADVNNSSTDRRNRGSHVTSGVHYSTLTPEIGVLDDGQIGVVWR